MEFQKYNVKEKRGKKKGVTKIIKKIYMKFAFLKKNRVSLFFFKVIVGYKSKN